MWKINNKLSFVVIIVIVVAILAISFLYFKKQSFSVNVPPSSSQLNEASSTSTQVSSIAKSDHIYDYLFSFITALHNLYLSTQEQQNVADVYSSSSGDIQAMTVMLQVDTDLSNAVTALQPYINDSDEAIKASAGLLYIDILTYKDANHTVSEAFRNITVDSNPQDIKYAIAKTASAQHTIQNDLLQQIFPIIKAVIQIPTESNSPTGEINYSISEKQRQDLMDDIKNVFGSSLDNYKDNIYTLAVKVLQLTLTPRTYEEQKGLKLP